MNWKICALLLAALSAVAPACAQHSSSEPVLDVSAMDRTIDPCVDFYKFSCDGWEKNNPIPADQAGWSVYAKLANDNQQFLWGILAEDAKAQNRTPVQQKVGDYFGACMDTTAIDALGKAVGGGSYFTSTRIDQNRADLHGRMGAAAFAYGLGRDFLGAFEPTAMLRPGIVGAGIGDG